MERARLGLVGLNFGRHIVRDLMEGKGAEDIELCAVCDLDGEKVREHATAYGLRGYTDINALLADPQIEAVGLFTGPAGRAGLVAKIIRAGKHVMTTKPLELDAGGMLAVLHEAREKRLAVHLNSPGPLPAADTAQILEWQAEFALGPAIGARWETYALYNEKPDGSWQDDPERCPVAPIFRLGIYGINELLQIFGPAQSVQVCHSRIFTGRPTPDNAQMSISFSSGGLASIYASFCIGNGRPYPNSLNLHFRNGSITRNTAPTPQAEEDNGAQMTLQALDGAGSRIIRQANFPSHTRAGAYQWNNFKRAVRSGSPLPGEISPELLVNGIRLINAMARSEKSGRNEEV